MTSSEAQKRWWIYVLIETRPDHKLFGQPRYVGWTTDPRRRFKKHLGDAKHKRTQKECWVAAVIQSGLKPVMMLVESGIGDDTWPEAETRWIARYRALGHDLTNATDGGEGQKGLVHSENTRMQMSAAHAGKKFTEEHKANIADALRGKDFITPEIRAKIAAAQKGKPRGPHSAEHKAKISAANKNPGPETRARMSAAQKGRIVSAETRAKLSIASTNNKNFEGKTHSSETRAKISAAKKGKPGKSPNAETRAKISAAHKGRPKSEETRAKISAALKGRAPKGMVSDVQVCEIRRIRTNTELTLKEIAAQCGVSKATVHRIVTFATPYEDVISK